LIDCSILVCVVLLAFGCWPEGKQQKGRQAAGAASLEVFQHFLFVSYPSWHALQPEFVTKK
jgi:hypothetical protein